MNTNFSVSTHKAFNYIDEWLEKPTNLIKLIDLETQKPISWIVNGSRKYLFTAEDIASKYTNVLELFNKLYKIDHTNIAVQFKSPNGSSTKTNGKALKITLKKELSMSNSVDNNDVKHNSIPVKSQNHNYNENNMHTQFGGLGAAAQQMGLGVVELIDLKTNQQLFVKLKEDYNELKATSKKDIEDLKSEIKILQIDNRVLEADNKTKDKEKELALKSQGLDQQTFFNSESGKELTTGVMDIAKVLASGKPEPDAVSGLGAANVSDAKSQLIDYIVSDQVTDETADNFMSFVMYHMAKTPAFATELQTLIDKYQNN